MLHLNFGKKAKKEVDMRSTTRVICVLIVMTLSQGAVSANTDLPHEFGTLVPVFKPAKPVDTRYTRNSVAVSFTTEKTFDLVVNYYHQALTDSGWRMTPSSNGQKLIAQKKGINLTLSEKNDIQGFKIFLHYPGGRE